MNIKPQTLHILRFILKEKYRILVFATVACLLLSLLFLINDNRQQAEVLAQSSWWLMVLLVIVHSLNNKSHAKS